ncbi:hypothetical protein [Sinorhizobium sp. BG8]|uniref:hypothetical protein n=1 Tax=Sinorhizobium sp. BG8 TaxID=2613773 RepID=UPI00193E692D|nr:hypothetical protein [Sinorhizobium sp. BG8]QRM56473.1 hypothetical protein F3Y30_19475 [Sinorhizobium sp. BG8]
MVSGIFPSRSRRHRRGDWNPQVEDIEQQLSELRDEIAALAKVMKRDAAAGVASAREHASTVKGKVEDLKDVAEGDIADLIAAGEDIIADLRERYRDSGRQVRETVREHPLATIGAAVAAGLLLAAIFRR